MTAFGSYNVLALLAIAAGAAVGALLARQRSVVAYGSLTRAAAAAMAGGLALTLAAAPLSSALYGVFVGTNYPGSSIGLICAVPVGVVLCGLVGGIVAARSPLLLAAVLGAGIGAALASQWWVRPEFSTMPTSRDMFVILGGGVLGAVYGAWLAGWKSAEANRSGDHSDAL